MNSKQKLDTLHEQIVKTSDQVCIWVPINALVALFATFNSYGILALILTLAVLTRHMAMLTTSYLLIRKYKKEAL